MKRIWIALILALAVGLAGCGKQETPPASPSEDAGQSSQPAPESQDTPPLVEAQPGEAAVPVDAALYRGQVEKLEDRDGNQLVTLSQVAGTNFGSDTLTALLDQTTRAGFDFAQLKEGDYLEVYYGGQADEGQEVHAIAANLLPPADLSIFNGTVEEILPGEEGKDLLLTDLDGKGKILFHLGEESQVYLDAEALAVGDKVNIYFSGITTRSEPPQATALEVYPYAER